MAIVCLYIYMGSLCNMDSKFAPQLCGIESPCEYEYDCEFLGTICAPIIVFPQWNPPPCNEKGTDTPDPNQEQCAVLRFWIPVWECVFPVGGCGGVRAWPDPDCR